MPNKWILLANGVLFLAVLFISLTVDGNGRILGLGEFTSQIITAGLFLAAMTTACILITKGKTKGRLAGIALGVFYLATLVPAFLP